MKLRDLIHPDCIGLSEAGEREYISSINMDVDYRVSPEAGDISTLMQSQDDSDNWFVTQIRVSQKLRNALNKKC